MKDRLIKGWCLLAGAMDATTGVLLVAAPQWTLGLRGVPAPGPAAIRFISWIGVFVAGVGGSYLLALWPRSAVRVASVRVFTTWLRLLVAGFVSWRIAAGELAVEWWTVAATDAVVAAGQAVLWRFGWLKDSLK